MVELIFFNVSELELLNIGLKYNEFVIIAIKICRIIDIIPTGPKILNHNPVLHFMPAFT